MANENKLKFEAYASDKAGGASSKGEITLQYNPKSIVSGGAPQYKSLNELGNTGATRVFVGMGSTTLDLTEILVDGTGLTPLPQGENVDDYILALRKVVYDYSAEDHEPPYVLISWGKINFVGKCEAFDIDYKMFKKDGTPLRASINMKFVSSASPAQKAILTKKSSPDLTHLRTVNAGDTLPLMAYRIYGDSSYYLEVARVNNLAGVNTIRPGDVLYFPPLKK